MQYRTVCVVALSLMASATQAQYPTIEQTREMAATASVYELCTALLRYPQSHSGVLMDEIVQRKADCQPYWAAEQARAAKTQQDAANTAAALQIIRQMQQPITPIQPLRPSTNCYSTVIGNHVQTICN